MSTEKTRKERPLDVGVVDRCTDLSLVTRKAVSFETKEDSMYSWAELADAKTENEVLQHQHTPHGWLQEQARDCWSSGVWFCYVHCQPPTPNTSLYAHSHHIPLVSNAVLDNAKRLDSLSSALRYRSCASSSFLGHGASRSAENSAWRSWFVR